MPRKVAVKPCHCLFSQMCNFGTRRFSPVKSFSKVKTVKTLSMFCQKKKKYSNGRSRKQSSQFYKRSGSNEFPSVSCNFSDNSWFWSNYELAQQWQRVHTMSVQRANMATNLHQETLLKPFGHSFFNSNSFEKPIRRIPSQKAVSCAVGINLMGSLSSLETDVTDQSPEDKSEVCGIKEEYEFEFKVDENMRIFLEQSMRHKQEMQRLKEAEEEALVDADMFEAPKESAVDERKKTMDALYGDAAPKILSMEMALQMSFDRHFDQKQPAFWPNLPLNL